MMLRECNFQYCSSINTPTNDKSSTIYNATTAAMTKAPIAPIEPERRAAPLVAWVTGPVEVEEVPVVLPVPVGLAVVFRPIDVELVPDPLATLVRVEGAAPVPEGEPMPLPAPPPGDNPLPPVTIALVGREDTELDVGLALPVF
jgi:hypothetical protein